MDQSGVLEQEQASNLERYGWVVGCGLMLLITFVALQQYAERKASDRAYNLAVTSKIETNIRAMEANNAALAKTQEVTKYVRDHPEIPAPIRATLGAKLERVQTIALNQQQLMNIMRDHLQEYRPGSTFDFVELIAPAFADSGAAPQQPSLVKQVILITAFVMLGFLFVVCTVVSFTSNNRRRTLHAMEILKIETSFLVGTASAVLASLS